MFFINSYRDQVPDWAHKSRRRLSNFLALLIEKPANVDERPYTYEKQEVQIT